MNVPYEMKNVHIKMIFTLLLYKQRRIKKVEITAMNKNRKGSTRKKNDKKEP